jgi:hypothetical protein
MIQIETGREVAVKVIKRKDMSHEKVMQEVEILKQAGKVREREGVVVCVV